LTFPAGRRVRDVIELGDRVHALMYGKPVPSRRVRGPWEDALSRYAGRPLTFLWADDGAVDRASAGGAVSLISVGLTRAPGEEAGAGGALDGRRFRLIGREVQIGEATVSFAGDIGRGVVTSRDPDTGIVDTPTLAALAAYRQEGYEEPLRSAFTAKSWSQVASGSVIP
jgi:hypothetical protein